MFHSHTKKSIIKLLAVLLLAALLSSCARSGGAEPPSSGGKVSVVTTVFPIYDWTRRVAGASDKVEITYLLKSGVDMHSYDPGAAELAKIADCDLLICVGGESDAWLDDFLSSNEKEGRRVVRLLDVEGAKQYEEERTPGMKEERSEGHEDAGDGQETEEHEPDEHPWMSVANAEVYTAAIASALAEANPENAELYGRNADSYIDELKELASGDEAAGGEGEMLVFADRYPFRYLLEEHGLRYCAAFAGCSAESEADFETVVFLADKVRELGSGAILMSESGDPALAETVMNTAGKRLEVIVLDSMQSIGAEELAEGADYINIMENNLRLLGRARELSGGGRDGEDKWHS